MFSRKYVFRGILLIVVLGMLFAPVSTESLWSSELLNSGHTILFVFVVFVIHPLVKMKVRKPNVLSVYFYVLALGFLLGVFIEILQTMVGREASLNDLYRNFFGLMAGIFLHAAFSIFDIYRKRLVAVFLVLCGVLFIYLGMAQLIRLSWHYIERADAFPVIADIDSRWISSFIRYNEGSYPGVALIEPEPDWSAYSYFRFKVHSANGYVTNLVLRVHDKMHNQEYSDRYNIKLEIKPGFNEFEVPLKSIRYGPVDRELELDNIAGVILYSRNQEEWSQVVLSDFSLK